MIIMINQLLYDKFQQNKWQTLQLESVKKKSGGSKVSVANGSGWFMIFDFQPIQHVESPVIRIRVRWWERPLWANHCMRKKEMDSNTSTTTKCWFAVEGLLLFWMTNPRLLPAGKESYFLVSLYDDITVSLSYFWCRLDVSQPIVTFYC